MKYKTGVYILTAVTVLITLAALVSIVLDAFNIIEIPLAAFCVICILFLGLVFACLFCACLIQVLHEDWKWRHVKDDRWRR